MIHKGFWIGIIHPSLSLYMSPLIAYVPLNSKTHNFNFNFTKVYEYAPPLPPTWLCGWYEFSLTYFLSTPSLTTMFLFSSLRLEIIIYLCIPSIVGKLHAFTACYVLLLYLGVGETPCIQYCMLDIATVSWGGETPCKQNGFLFLHAYN